MHSNKLLLNNIIDDKDKYSFDEVIYFLSIKFSELVPFEVTPRFLIYTDKKIPDYYNNHEYTLVPFGFSKIDRYVNASIFSDIFIEYLSEEEKEKHGVYYTSEDEVHLICNQTLRKYLITNLGKDFLNTSVNDYFSCLERISVIDPACGCGAFLVGMIYNIYSALRDYIQFHKGSESSYDLNLLWYSVCNYSINGIELDSRSAQISMIRIWFAYVGLLKELQDDDLVKVSNLLVLDEQILNQNALIQMFDNVNIANFTLTESKLEGINILDKFESLNKPLKDSPEMWNTCHYTASQAILKNFNSFIGSKTTLNSFNDQLLFKGGFDIVIGNPPYVQLDTFSFQEKLAINDSFKSLSYYYPELNWNEVSIRRDIYIDFYFLGFRLLKSNGIIGFLTSDSWLDASYGAILQEFLLKRTNCSILTDVDKRSFNTASINTNIVIAQLSNKDNTIEFVKYQGIEDIISDPIVIDTLGMIRVSTNDKLKSELLL